MIYWTAHFVGGPLDGKVEYCAGATVKPTFNAITLREGEAFGARELAEDSVPIVNAYVTHEYRESGRERSGRFGLAVFYVWTGEPKIPQVEGVL